MIKFSRDKVLLLHQIISQETGGDPNLRDINLLDSALESAFQTFDGKELYPTKEEKAARIGYSLISNHAFVDGNKRIGMYVLLSFLEVNGIKIRPSDEEVVRVGLATAAGEMKYEDILAWISEKNNLLAGCRKTVPGFQHPLFLVSRGDSYNAVIFTSGSLKQFTGRRSSFSFSAMPHIRLISATGLPSEGACLTKSPCCSCIILRQGDSFVIVCF